MLDDKEAIQQLKRQRRHCEEIERDDDLPVILEKRYDNSKCMNRNGFFRTVYLSFS